MNWNSDLTQVKGIGEKTVKLFHKLDLHTVRDLLYYFPKDYDQFEESKKISECESGGMVTIRARIPGQNMMAMSVAENMYGTIILWKLIPQERIATISESEAIFDVKNMTVMNTNRGLNMFMKYGTKLT